MEAHGPGLVLTIAFDEFTSSESRFDSWSSWRGLWTDRMRDQLV